MTVGTNYACGITYQDLQNLYGTQTGGGTATVDNNVASLANESDTTSFSVSESGETCTDGKDDGKIGVFSALGNAVKGAVNGLCSGVKGMFCDENGFSLKNTAKSAAMIGACFIPGVGPFVAAGLCTVGLVKGATGMAKSISAAASAETDAEAKEAFQSLGSSTLTTGLSAVGLKGATGAIVKSAGYESILGKGTSTTETIQSSIGEKGIINTAKDLVSESVTKPYADAIETGMQAGTKGSIKQIGGVTKEVVKTGAKGTAENMIGAAKTIKNDISNTYNKLTGKTGTGTAEQIANQLSTKKTTITADDIKVGKEVQVDGKTYSITEGTDGNNLSYSLKSTKPTKTTTYIEPENLQENVSLDKLDKTGFSEKDISKIENLNTNQSYTTENGTKITKTTDGYSSTETSATKTTIYENVSTDKLSQLVGEDIATDINTQLKANEYLGKGNETIYIKGENGTTYYYEPPKNTLSSETNVSPTIAKINNATNNTNYTYTPIITDVAEEI
ncbi:MAG: hypothetical protein LUG16_07585 [Candidatus Gastranaerophilales bacterium]|nr:hypothetical protein [Candidatus Gastranaerophilales bacterium]